MTKPLVIIESPYAAGSSSAIYHNICYARECVKDSLMRGEAPIASHLLYTQKDILDDSIPEERQLGIDAGLEWRRVSDMTVVYMDKGISTGMQYGIDKAKASGKEVIYRWLYKEAADQTEAKERPQS